MASKVVRLGLLDSDRGIGYEKYTQAQQDANSQTVSTRKRNKAVGLLREADAEQNDKVFVQR